MSCLLLETSCRSFIPSNSWSINSLTFTTLSSISDTCRAMSSTCSSWMLVSSKLFATSPTTRSVTEFSISWITFSILMILLSILFTSLNDSCQMPFNFLIDFIRACTSSLTILSNSLTFALVAWSVSVRSPSILWNAPTSCFLRYSVFSRSPAFDISSAFPISSFFCSIKSLTILSE